jgi:hypothetical protein
LIQVYCKNNEHVDLGVQFQVGDSVALINPTKEDIIAIGIDIKDWWAEMFPPWHPY